MSNPTSEMKWVAFGERRSASRRSFLAIHKSNWYESDVYTVWYDGKRLARWPLSLPPTHYAEIVPPTPVLLTYEQYQTLLNQSTNG